MIHKTTRDDPMKTHQKGGTPMKNKPETGTAGEILTTVFSPMEYLVDGLLPQGLFILAGTQKVVNVAGDQV